MKLKFAIAAAALAASGFASAQQTLSEAQKVHFNDGGQFDKLYAVK